MEIVNRSKLMELFAVIVKGLKPLTIFTKISVSLQSLSKNNISSEFGEIFQNICIMEHLRMAASTRPSTKFRTYVHI